MSELSRGYSGLYLVGDIFMLVCLVTLEKDVDESRGAALIILIV